MNRLDEEISIGEQGNYYCIAEIHPDYQDDLMLLPAIKDIWPLYDGSETIKIILNAQNENEAIEAWYEINNQIEELNTLRDVPVSQELVETSSELLKIQLDYSKAFTNAMAKRIDDLIMGLDK